MKNLKLTILALLLCFSSFAIGPITGPTSVCAPNNIILRDTSAGGIWSSSNTAIAAVLMPSYPYGAGYVYGVSAGTVTISYTIGTVSATTTLTVNAGLPRISGYLPSCNLDTTTYRNATPGGTWSSSNTSVAIINPTSGFAQTLSEGNAAITYTAAGCYVTTYVSVNLPIHDMWGCDNVGVGDTMSFVGVNDGSDLYTNPAIAAIDRATGRITGISPGTTTVAMFNPVTGCIHTSRKITVTATTLIKPISRSAPVCAGTGLMLSDGTPGGTWSSSDTTIATISSTGKVNTLMEGMPTITYAVTGATCTTPIFVSEMPVAFAGPTTICVGDTVILHSGTYTRYRFDTIDYSSDWYNLGPFYIDGSTLPPSNVFTSSDTTIAKLVKVTYPENGHIKGISAGQAIISYTDQGTKCAVTTTVTVSGGPVLPAITGKTTLCTGRITTMSNPVSGGTWSSSNTIIATVNPATGVVNAIAGGTATISYTVSDKCGSTTQTIGLKIEATVPVISGIAGSNSLCAGSVISVSDATPGGTWSSSNTSVAAISSGIVTGNTAGTATISYTLSNVCGSNSAIKTITVYPLPAAITGSFNICQTDTSTVLADASVSGTWSSSDISVATIGSSTGIVNALSIGTSTVTYTLPTGCLTTEMVTINPVVVPSVSITAAVDTVCEGSQAFFAATIVNGGTAPHYQWNVNRVSSGADTAYYYYTPVNGDEISVVASSSAVCAIPDTVTASHTMTVVKAIIPSMVITASAGITIAPGQTDTFTAILTGGISPSYQWLVNAVPVPGATTSAYISDSLVDNDSVSCFVVNSDHCSFATFNSVIIHITHTLTGNINRSCNIYTYPNPAKDILSIRWKNIMTDDARVVITDVCGRVVHRTKLDQGSLSGIQQIDLSDLMQGVYTIAVTGASVHYSSKLVIGK